MKQETLDKHPELEKVLNQLANQITDEEMREMNYEVDYKDKPAHDVAKTYLAKKGLLK